MASMPDREALARAEMDATHVGAATRRVLVLAFLAVLASGTAIERWAPAPPEAGYRPVQLHPPSAAEWVAAWRERGPRTVSRELRALLRRIDEWSEKDLSIGRRLRSPVQRFLLTRLRYGNAQVRAGRDGWLFYEREIDALTGPPFLDRGATERTRLGDPEAVIRDLAADLRARGLGLALVPVPAKSAIEAARLLGRRAPDAALHNPSCAELARRLEPEGIVLFDPAPLLVEMARTGEPAYLRTDSHWRPEAVDRVAAAMAREIFARGVLPEPTAPRFRRTAEIRVGHPDLVRLLGLPIEGVGPLYEAVTVQVVRDLAGEIFVPSDALDAPILLLGDSLAGNYGWGGQGYGSGAGLAEQLAFHLQTPVQAILEPASGRLDSRERLADFVRHGHDPLVGKRLVILEFAERELAIGPWRPARLPAVAPR